MNLEIGHTIFGFISWFVWYLRNTTLIFDRRTFRHIAK